jgi:hypothetical protein
VLGSGDVTVDPARLADRANVRAVIQAGRVVD